MAQLKQNGEIRDREIQLRCADGSTRWVKISKTFTSTDDTTIIDGLIEDISKRKQAEVQVAFLAEASRRLSSSLDYQTTLETLANLAVPALADVCLVGAVEPETLVFQEPIVAATEPEQRALVLEIRRRYPPTAQDEYGSGKVLRAGQAELQNDIPEAVLEQIAHNTEHLRLLLRLLQQLTIKAWLIVPMIVGDRKVGTIALLQTKRHYGFDYADLDVAEELARRTAVALDNVRLYQEAQQANQAKDEFLAIVSHE